MRYVVVPGWGYDVVDTQAHPNRQVMCSTSRAAEAAAIARSFNLNDPRSPGKGLGETKC